MSFKAVLEANISGWEKDLNKAQGSMSSFATKTKKDLDALTSAQKKSSTVAMEFNRIVQDAPFGMIGISNNLTQLTDNYKNYANLVRQAAAEQGKSISNFQILKGAIGGIFSPLNLFSLGLAAVTSGIILYTNWKQKASKATKESTDAMKQLVESLNYTSKVMYDGAKAAGQESAQLNTLYNITQDVSKATNERQDAANRLIKQYPDLFKNFTTEQIMLGQAKGAYDKLSNSILATARAQAAYGAIGEKAAQQIAIDEVNKGLREQLEAEKKLNTEREKAYRTGNGGNAYSSVNSIETIEYANSLGKVDDIQKQITSNLLERAKLQEEMNNLEQIAITNQVAQQDIIPNATKAATTAKKDYVRELTESLAAMGYYDTALGAIAYKYIDLSILAKQAGADAAILGRIAREELGEKLTLALGQASGVEAVAPKIKIGLEFDVPSKLPGLDKAFAAVKQAGDNAKPQFEEMFIDLSGAIGNGISNIASSFGEALVTGENLLGNLGKSLIGMLGNLAKSIGEQLIAFGTAGLALKMMIKNPVLAIAAGAALVALGSAASASISKTVSGASGSSGGYSSSSSITSSSNAMPNYFQGAYSDNNTVVFEIEGDKLKGVLERLNRKDRRTR